MNILFVTPLYRRIWKNQPEQPLGRGLCLAPEAGIVYNEITSGNGVFAIPAWKVEKSFSGGEAAEGFPRTIRGDLTNPRGCDEILLIPC